MKKSVIITIGVVLILIVLAVWGYLLFFGTPGNSDEVFSNLGLGDSPARPAEQQPDTLPPQDEPTTQVDTEGEALQQLTTRPVAGFTFVGTSTNAVRYVERGTGHVFEIELSSGAERRVSGTTIPRVVDAVFSESGGSVALISEEGGTRTVLAGRLEADGEQTDYITLANGAFDPAFVAEYRLHYGVVTDSGTEGYELDVRDDQPLRLFSIPLRQISILRDDDTYVYNRPTDRLQGALYRVGAGLTPVTERAYGFIGGINDAYYFGTEVGGEKINSYAVDRNSGEETQLAITYIPQKCDTAPGSTTTLWCAAPLEEYAPDFIESWYKGTVLSADLLWQANIPRGEARLFVDFLEEAGRPVDVDGLAVGANDELVLLRNKIDNTLWLYDSTVQ